MYTKSKFIERTKDQLISYSFNKSLIPFPDSSLDKNKPPESIDLNLVDNSSLFKPKEIPSLEVQAQEYMDAYRKAERIVVNNFYTGGGAYKRGVMDAIYRGINPLNP